MLMLPLEVANKVVSFGTVVGIKPWLLCSLWAGAEPGGANALQTRSHKRIPRNMRLGNLSWRWLLVFLSLSEGTKSSEKEEATEVSGALGESVTFQLKTSEPFKLIAWLKSEANKTPSNIALVNPPCSLNVVLLTFKGRLSASEDCRGLQVSDLRPGDSGTYTAQVLLVDGGESLKENFDLRVYKRLTEADLTVQCLSSKNGTRRLNCSAGPWEDDVAVRWDDASKAEQWGKFAVLELNVKDLNVTCIAKNPIGEASKVVSVKETCEGSGNSGVVAGVAIGIVGLILLLAVMGCWWTKKAAGRKHLDSAEAGNPCQTLYTEVGNVVSRDVGAPQPQPRRKPPKGKNDTIQTIYTTVSHAQTPPQTDNEKTRKRRQGGPDPGEKTVYSEIASSQESEDQSLKTVYETVKNPQPPRTAEYNTII